MNEVLILALRPNDRISYRDTAGTWRSARVLRVEEDGIVATTEDAIVRLGWDDVYPPF